jgi:hypothetical protein
LVAAVGVGDTAVREIGRVPRHQGVLPDIEEIYKWSSSIIKTRLRSVRVRVSNRGTQLSRQDAKKAFLRRGLRAEH